MNDHTSILPHLKFRFNLEHPSLEECYVYGYECACAGILEGENPYREASREADEWSEGWWAGFYGNERLFNEETPVLSDDFAFEAVNDTAFHETRDNYLTKVLEIAGVIAVSAILGYQVIDMVA